MIGLICFAWLNGTAQIVEKVPLTKYLDKVQSKFGVTFSYNSTLLKPLQIENPTENLSLQETIEFIKKQIAIRIDTLVENEFIIVPIRTKVEFVVLDYETHKSIPIISLKVNNENAKYLITQADKYIVSNLFASDSLVFESTFYSKAKLTVSDLIANNNTIMLVPDTIKLDEVSVVAYMGSGVDYKISDHSFDVDYKNLGLLAGETDGDVLQLLRSIPGIKTPSGKPGNLSIRGSRFSDNLICFDNIPIYHQGHFFGTISPYNPGIVDKMYVYRGTLPANRGGRVGGLVDIHTKNNVPEQVQGGISMNTVYAAAQLNLPVIKNKLGLLLSARSNYQLNGLSPKMQQYSDLNFQGSKISSIKLDENNKLEDLAIRFQDINGKLTYNINKGHNVSISFIRINNNFSYLFRSISHNGTENQNADLNNWGIAAKWTGQINPKLSASVITTKSLLDITEKIIEEEKGVIRKSDIQTNMLNDSKLSTEIKYRVNSNTKISLGYEWKNQNISYSDNKKKESPPPQGENSLTHTHTLFSNLNKKFGKKLIGNIGLHCDYYQAIEQWYIDPRLFMTYLATNRFSLKSSYGRSHQYIKQDLLTDFEDFLIANHFWHMASKKRPPLEGYKGMFGATLDFIQWIIDIEFYANKTNNVSKGVDHTTGIVPIGSLASKGVDLFVKKHWRNIEAWAAYSLSETLANFSTIDVAYFDQTHSINLMLITNFKRWNAAISWNYNTGLPVILPDLSVGNNQNPDFPEFIDVPFKNRFPAQHQMDLSLTYQLWPQGHRLKGVVGLSFLNLYNQENIINLYQKQISKYDLYRNTIGFSPNLQVKISF